MLTSTDRTTQTTTTAASNCCRPAASLNPFLLIDWGAGPGRMSTIVESMQSEARGEGFGFH